MEKVATDIYAFAELRNEGFIVVKWKTIHVIGL